MAEAKSGWKSRLVAPAAVLVRLVIRALGWATRYVVVHGERLEAALGAGGPVVLSFWHDQTVSAAWFLLTRVHRRGLPVTLLASHSRDGDLTVRICRPWGARVVRGSASRGGRQAIMALYRELVDHGSSPMVVPDGPRGPLHECKPGALVLAKMAKVPILPLGFAPGRCWRLGSWDRMTVPKPGARIGVAVGEPIAVARDASSEELETLRCELAGVLDGLVVEAAALVSPGAVGENEP
ncbi:MAG: lysophospholipid acyltransferase family protein [Thermoanaerobaculia bacterium]|nr:lysophospholipid acyltransferase family protein [Thermoanaerobaculia bacterium]